MPPALWLEMTGFKDRPALGWSIRAAAHPLAFEITASKIGRLPVWSNVQSPQRHDRSSAGVVLVATYYPGENVQIIKIER